jgi:hypothetical protein
MTSITYTTPITSMILKQIHRSEAKRIGLDWIIVLSIVEEIVFIRSKMSSIVGRKFFGISKKIIV